MKAFIFDFDGTITTEDTTDLILEIPDEDEIWRIEQQWKLGKITSYQCMKAQAKFLRGITTEGIADHLKQHSRMDPNFLDLVRSLEATNCCMIVLSEGYDISIRFHEVQKYIKEIRCSELVVKNGVLTGQLRVLNEKLWNYNDKCIGCCICKVGFLYDLNRRFNVTRSFAVGDGRSDECLFQHVDVSFSLDPQLKATYQVKNLSDVLDILSLKDSSSAEVK